MFLAFGQSEFSCIFPYTLWEWKNVLWYLLRPMQQSTVFGVSGHPLVPLTVCVQFVSGRELCLVKNAQSVLWWDFGGVARGRERGRQVENAWAWPRHHHHFHFRFHHRPNHQHRHRVNKRAYSSYIRNAIPLWRTLCQHFVRKSLCKTMPNALALGSEVFQLSLSAFLWFPFLFGYMLPFTFSAVNIFESFQIK